MDIHKNAQLTPQSRAAIVRRVLDQGQPPAAVAVAVGVCARTVRKWVVRYQAEGADGLRDRSSRPHRQPRALPAAVAAQVVALRRRRWSGAHIAATVHVSPAPVSRILRRAPAGAGLHLIVYSTGLSIVGEGEWASAKHGGRGRRGWKKRHLGVDRSGVIVTGALTEASVDDATTGIALIEAVDGALGRVTADAAYDTIGFYEAAGARGATVVVPPTSTAYVSRHGPRSSARDRTILAVKEIGRRRWKKTPAYHGQARVENAFFRYTSIIGDTPGATYSHAYSAYPRFASDSFAATISTMRDRSALRRVV